jgi:peptide-methionine (S)-S-oxide reductase
VAAALPGAAAICWAPDTRAERGRTPGTAFRIQPRMRTETATLAGGCYWCLEAAYEALQGVRGVVSGFSGGDPAVTTYREVCGGQSGHAEVVRVTFDPDVVTFDDLLAVFFTLHDPTTPNRQGADVGTQYRSAIFVHSPAQRESATRAIAALTAEGVFPDPIVTEVLPFTLFLPADSGHQGYYRRNSAEPYCRAVISPKLAKLRARWAHLLKPALRDALPAS